MIKCLSIHVKLSAVRAKELDTPARDMTAANWPGTETKSPASDRNTELRRGDYRFRAHLSRTVESKFVQQTQTSMSTKSTVLRNCGDPQSTTSDWLVPINSRPTVEQHNKQLEQLTNGVGLTHHSRAKRSTAHIANNEYTIEVLVAVDKKMQEYHRDTLKSYVLTLMSIVSSIYADASIGNSIKIAVVHILYLHQDLAASSKLDQNGSKGVSASEMLQAFCKLKAASNFHHDTAFLLTREQICRHQSKCDTLGLAELGTMCKRSSCAIVQDNGLSAAFTIAHELGHVLSMPHDDDVRCIPFRGEGSGKQNIMSRMLDQNTHPWSWSNCSRNFVTEYLEQNHAACMLDKPTTDLIEPSSSHTKLAGEKFTNNQQCELVFGNGSRICSYMPVCERLWCNNGDELLGCRTQHMPWADGTSCGENQWCQKGQCVHVNRKALQPQDGGWGQWSPCGEGVKHIKYQCIQRFLKSQQTNPVDSTFCSNIPTPRTMEKCHGTCPDATWSYGDWDLQESTYAYSGEETRPSVIRHSDNNHEYASRNDISFSNASQSLQQPHPYKWCKGVWTPCNAKCNGGTRWRKVQCCHTDNESATVHDRYCHHEKKPMEKTNCGNFRCPQWNFGQWGECNVTCGGGDGYRTGERVCMRLFPKSADNPHPVKTGRKVDAKNCAHVKIPPAKKLVRKCKPCQFRWECKCDGFQRRSVKCYDEITKTESIRCPETRPYQKRKCEPAQDCRQRYSKSVAFSCADVQRIRRTRADGEYTLSVQGRPVSVYCHNMTSNAPAEYVTLKSGLVENYAIYINRRAANAGVCAPSSADWVDESISYGATHYRKIRLNIGTLQVVEDDHRFTDRSGQPQAFGSAGDCYSNTGLCPQGDFSINLEGTPFRIRPRTQWETKGQNAVIHFLIRLEAPYKKVRARCGGYCGTCSVSRSGLFLELE
ncbi:hypothetical protein quinque_000843 [Culex quinquefasciatus]